MDFEEEVSGGSGIKDRCENGDSVASDRENNQQLINLALQLATEKVVVKRAAKAAALADIQPASSISGKAVRFDVYPTRR